MIHKTNICVAVSGGETSAYMAFKIQGMINTRFLDQRFNIKYVFANTGQENEETLVFLKELDEEFGFNIVWLESVTHHDKRKSCTHKIVDFESASRDGEPFEEMCKKYGVPNKHFMHCTRELKNNPIKSYLKSIGWGSTKDYIRMIGIRMDEIDRISPTYQENGLYYPLITDFPTNKMYINEYWDEQSFRLNLKQYQGNCKWCYKKTLRKHLTIITENPEWYDFPKMLEEKYSHIKPKKGTTERRMFRGERKVEDLFKLSLEPFTPFHDEARVYRDELDRPGAGCTEECEPFAE